MTWNKGFEDIEDFLEILDEKGRNLVVIIDPHIKNDNSYFLFQGANEKSNFINNSFYFFKNFLKVLLILFIQIF